LPAGPQGQGVARPNTCGQGAAIGPGRAVVALAQALPDGTADVEQDAGTTLLFAVAAGLPLTWDGARQVVLDGLRAVEW